jgi:hypothetical protein
MHISDLAPELVGCLRTKLGQAQVAIVDAPPDPNAISDADVPSVASAPSGTNGSNGTTGIHDHDE